MAKKQDGTAGKPFRKPLLWLSGEVKTPPFTPEGRQEAGMLLRLFHEGERLEMPQSEPLTDVCHRCGALRERDAGHSWRIMYRIYSDAVLVPGVYSKKTRTIPKATIDRCIRRLAQYDEAVKAAKKK